MDFVDRYTYKNLKCLGRTGAPGTELSGKKLTTPGIHSPTYGYVLKRKKEFAEFHHAVTYLLEHDYCARSIPHMKAVNWGPML